MKKMTFNAYAIASEIELNKIATECNIPKKYTWEEPLILQGSILSKILGKDISEDKKIMVFSFGSIVFINS
ncbi:MAG: RMD1 family protein, partial [Clostridiaceae bacterium]|nr:RMD1 family protein [Clostridiaceae bacterium]